MEVTERKGALHLVVRGPGVAVASYDFPDRDRLLEFTREQELELMAAGFQLQAVAERRSGVDRRAASRQSTTDRRRS
jgi:hypothetical protein